MYYFDKPTIEHIEFLATPFGGREKGIAAAVDIASNVLNGTQPELQIKVK